MWSRVNRHPDSLYPDDGPVYWRMWDVLDVSDKGESHAVMETILGENDYMSYLLGQ